MVSDADIVRRLTSVLRKADLATTTPAAIRKQLEKDLGIDLTERKAFIREQIDFILEQDQQATAEETEPQDGEQEGEDEEEEDEEEEEREEEEEEERKPAKKSRKSDHEPDSKRFRAKIDRAIKASLPKEKKKRSGGGGGLNKVCRLSPELQAVIGQTELPRTQVVKLLWMYIREKELQDPENKRKILCNDELRGLFGVESTDMFKMNKLLSKHIWPLEAPPDGEPETKKLKTEQKADKAPSERVKSEKKDSERPRIDKKENEKHRSEKKDSGRGRNSGRIVPSEALIQFLGTNETDMDQHDVLKFLWSYIVDNKLQDPADKRTIYCDEKLQGLFGCETLAGHSLAKLLASHLKG